LRENDVSIKVLFTGICHTDLHQMKNEWGRTIYPIVPGYEAVGIVEEIGSAVTKFKIGQRVGTGLIIDSCHECDNCKNNLEQHCLNGFYTAYGTTDRISGGLTYGAFSERLVVEDRYVLSISDEVDLAATAPLLGAGITVYTPLVESHIGPKSRVGIMGIGGLGHLGIKLARALGAHVVAFTSKASKKDELVRLGANEVVITSIPEEFQKVSNTLDLVIDTISGDHDVLPYLFTLKFRGTFHIVGSPKDGFNKIPGFPFIAQRINWTGSLVGSIKHTQEMLDLCAAKNVTSDVEVVLFKDIEHTLERLEKSEVRYRFVIDMQASLNESS
jgi:uncharacterized zinc-type alcohol dehydrogenase-like protein